MVLLLEGGDISVEGIKNWLDTFKIVLFKGLELVDGGEELDKLGDSSAEEFEPSENLVWRELELLTLWHVHETLLGELVLLDISNLKLNAALEHWNELIWWILLMIPKNIIGHWTLLVGLTSSDSPEVEDVVFALDDHLVGDLNKESGHSLVGVVVSGDGVDHLDTVHESWQGVLDSLWVSVVEWLDEFLKSLKIFDVIFGLVESFSDSKLNGSPLGGGKVNLVSWLSGVLAWVLGSLGKNIVDSSTVLAPELLGDTGQFSHSLLPVVELVLWTIFLSVLLLSISSFEGFRDLFRPLIEDFLEVSDHLVVERSVVAVDILGFSLPSAVVLLKVDVVLKGLQGLSELVGELIKDGRELLLVLFVTETPLIMSINERLVNLVDDSIERSDGMLRNLTKQDIVVIGTLWVDGLVVDGVSKEVNTLTL